MKVSLFENHDEAYWIWKKQNVQSSILVHIDAHLDVWWYPDRHPRDILNAQSEEELELLLKNTPKWNPDKENTRPNIGNFICQGIREKMINQVYCVVPDDFLDNPKKVKFWLNNLQGIIDQSPDRGKAFIDNDNLITGIFCGVRIKICAINDLPNFNEPVLLDIDTDYFITDFEGGQCNLLVHFNKKMPWITPKILCEKLAGKKLESKLTTIAYSVDEYFTPIKFKYLGDYLKLILEGMGDSREAKSYELLLSGRLEASLALNPENAAAHFQLALKNKSRESYQRAVELDPSYQTRFNNKVGLICGMGLEKLMDEEIKKTKTLDPGFQPPADDRDRRLAAALDIFYWKEYFDDWIWRRNIRGKILRMLND